MSLSFGLNPLLLVVCLLAAAGFTYWTYRRTTPPVSGALRYTLMGLRFAALFIVLLLLFEPVLRRLERLERPPVLAVLVDDSQSLSLTPGRDDSTAAPLGAQVRTVLQQLPDDLGGGETRLFRFSGDTQPLAAAAPDSLHFGGPRTDIAQALDYVQRTLQDVNLRGVLLVSDGQYNTGSNPLYQAERSSVPIHTVVVGDTTRQRDVQIRRVTSNEIAYVGTEQPLQVGIRSEDYAGERINVTLSRDGQILSREAVTLPEGTAEVNVDLSYVPDAEGLQRLTVAVSRLDGETTYRNNSEAMTVRVLRSKRRLLLVAAAPGPDVSALQQLLAGDPTTEVDAFIQKTPGSFYEGPFPTDLRDVDALVLAGYPGRGADPAVARRLAAAEKPIFFLLSRQTDLDALGRFFGDVLPAVPEAVRPGFHEAVVVPTPTGLQHPILEVPGTPAELLRRLPPLAVSQTRWQASPDARVLATPEVRGVALDDPLLVLRSRSGLRSAALLGAGTWRWKNVPADLEDAAPLWPGLFTNTIQWISTREDDRPVRVRPTRELFGGDEAVRFTGQVYDESLNPVDDASVEVEVFAPDSTRYPYVMQPIGNGRYTLDAGTLPEGTYRYRATARREDKVLGTDSGALAVGALTLEFKETRANAALMRQIAHRSGGTFLTADQVGTLPSMLQAAGGFTPVIFEEERETPLWHLYGLLGLVVLLLAAEWFLRKRSGMV